jgi:hypothetical protein
MASNAALIPAEDDTDMRYPLTSQRVRTLSPR